MDPLYQAIRINAHKYANRATWSNATFSSVNAFFKRNGANSYLITEGINPKIFKPGKVNVKKTIDIIFVGEKTPKRIKFVDFLRKNNININCYGPGWENKPIYIDKLVNEYKKSKIVLNFTRDKIGFSDRVFLTLGTNSFLISEYCRDLERFFKKGIHLEWFKSPEELLRLSKYYLENDEEREAIAKQGYKIVKENFTWDKIIEKIFKIINSKSKNNNL
ncbi:MAG: glycosyltransferase [Candidatus Hermodarchaeota archaeon]